MGIPSRAKIPSRKCGVCDAENIGYGSKCVQCGARLEKRKRLGRSKKSRAKEAKKRGVCSGSKKTYKSRAEANSALRAMAEKGRGLRSYWCKVCNGHHLTKLRQRG